MSRPILYILVGIPGSGKSTYAEKLSKRNNTVHLSSDSIRKELYGDESIQGNPADIFALMQDRAVKELNNGNNVIYDATNLTRKDRSNIIAICPKFVEIRCIVVWASIEECIRRDSERSRCVGKDVIDRMVRRFQVPYYDEGIDEIILELTDKQIRYPDLIESLDIPHDNPHHSLNIKEHCQAAIEYAIHNNFGFEIETAAVLHDCGKPYTKSFTDRKGNTCETAHYYDHQNVGAWIAIGAEWQVDIIWMINTHMGPLLNTKYYNNLPPYLKDKIDKLHECDMNSH